MKLVNKLQFRNISKLNISEKSNITKPSYDFVLKYKCGINSELTKQVLLTKTLVGPDNFDMRETRNLMS